MDYNATQLHVATSTCNHACTIDEYIHVIFEAGKVELRWSVLTVYMNHEC